MTPEAKSFEIASKLPVDLVQWLYEFADEREAKARSFGDKQPQLTAELRREATFCRMAGRELRLTLAECKRLRGILGERANPGGGTQRAQRTEEGTEKNQATEVNHG